MPPDDRSVLLPGPWSHREVTAGGLRIHYAECGPDNGPLVLLLHGFPQFWWTWRHQLPALGAAGLRVVAPDLRGYGATDKPPRGYDAYTLTADVAGLIRSLGARDATLVGHGLGGSLAWTVATLHPRLIRSVVALGAPHPVRLLEALRTDPAQARASSYLVLAQLPRVPEARLLRPDGTYVADLLARWGGPGYPSPEAAAVYAAAVTIPGVAHSAMEYYRWAFRSLTRPSGQRYLRLLRAGAACPVLQLHGAADGCVLPATARGSGAFARGGYRLDLMSGVGHFPQEEAPEPVTTMILEHAAA